MVKKRVLVILSIILLAYLGFIVMGRNKNAVHGQPDVTARDSSALSDSTRKTHDSTNPDSLSAEPMKTLSTTKWKTFTNNFGFSLQYPDGWTIDDASYASAGQIELFAWVLGPKRNAPPSHGFTQAQFKMPICDLGGKFTNQCYGPDEGEVLSLLYPGGTQAPNEIVLNKDSVKNTDEYRIAMAIMATASSAN